METLWGETFYRVWLPVENTVVRVRAGELGPIEEHAAFLSVHHLVYVAAAARIKEALAQGALLAPLEASVIPLPHQIYALSRAVSGERVRYLLADEVGLGKTIEAGLIMREMKLRGLVRRTLVVAPKGLVKQWMSEMRLHFNEEFQLVLPEDLAALRRVSGGNPWRYITQAVVPMDAVKPKDARRGWSTAQVAAYNRERFEDLISAGWDLVIVDEAHRLGGSTEQVARFKLGQGLAAAAPYLLLLSATPHQGKTDAFHRLLSLLDPEAFPDQESITRERVSRYVIRTEKRRAVDLEGKPLFKPRQTRLLPVSWEERHREQRLLYEAVTQYVRQGYNQAVREKKNYLGFLMILMQRLVTFKTADVLDSAEAEEIFDKLYLEALLNPGELEDKVASFLDLVREQARAAQENIFFYGGEQAFDPTRVQQLVDRRVEYWTETMTTAYLRAHGGRAERDGRAWNLVWPGGENQENVIFTTKDAAAVPPAKYLGLKDFPHQAPYDAAAAFSSRAADPFAQAC